MKNYSLKEYSNNENHIKFHIFQLFFKRSLMHRKERNSKWQDQMHSRRSEQLCVSCFPFQPHDPLWVSQACRFSNNAHRSGPRGWEESQPLWWEVSRFCKQRLYSHPRVSWKLQKHLWKGSRPLAGKNPRDISFRTTVNPLSNIKHTVPRIFSKQLRKEGWRG